MSDDARIGEMNKQVQFKMPVKNRDTTGGLTKEWVTSNAVWAKITHKTADEKEMTNKKTDVATVVFGMYYNEATRPTWRIIHGADEYEILSVIKHLDSMFMDIEARRYEDN